MSIEIYSCGGFKTHVASAWPISGENLLLGCRELLLVSSGGEKSRELAVW